MFFIDWLLDTDVRLSRAELKVMGIRWLHDMLTTLHSGNAIRDGIGRLVRDRELGVGLRVPMRYSNRS